MKKRSSKNFLILIIILIVLVVAIGIYLFNTGILMGPPSESVKCVDTDVECLTDPQGNTYCNYKDGINPYEQGTVNSIYTDYCLDNFNLREYYCSYLTAKPTPDTNRTPSPIVPPGEPSELESVQTQTTQESVSVESDETIVQEKESVIDEFTSQKVKLSPPQIPPIQKVGSVDINCQDLGDYVCHAGACEEITFCREMHDSCPFYNQGDVILFLESGHVFIEDFCSGDILTNYFCDGSSLESEEFNCPYGCSIGVCNPPSVLGAAPLFTNGEKIYLNDSINKAVPLLTNAELPNVLASGVFEGALDYNYIQKLEIGSNQLIFDKIRRFYPDDWWGPGILIKLSENEQEYLYKEVVEFNQGVDFTNIDSFGKNIELFWRQFMVSPTTDSTKLVLVADASSFLLTSNESISPVYVGICDYTVELVSASDYSATIRVTGPEGNTCVREISEHETRDVLGLIISVLDANENNLNLSASIIVGSDIITLRNNNEVQGGLAETNVPGTKVSFNSGNGNPANLQKIEISVFAPGYQDSIPEGEEFTDPVFKTIKVDFPGTNINSSDRELIDIKNFETNKMWTAFKSHDGTEFGRVKWAKVNPQGGIDLTDSDGKRIIVGEMDAANESEYVFFPSGGDWGLYKVMTIRNDSSGFSEDFVKLENVFTHEQVTMYAIAEGIIIFTIQGMSYMVFYYGASTIPSEAMQIRIDYPQSLQNQKILFPTIKTSKGAKVAFYKPTVLNLPGDDSLLWIEFPNGDNYTDVEISYSGTDFFINGQAVTPYSNAIVNVGSLRYEFSYEDTLKTKIYLLDVQGSRIENPATVMFEEKDDQYNYEALIVKIENWGDIGVEDVETTWGNDAVFDEIQYRYNSYLFGSMDRWGIFIQTDSSYSDQKKATILYNDEQLFGKIYVSEIFNPGKCSCNGECTLCGNGQMDPGEECENWDLNGQTCESLGFDGGTLSCHLCSFDTSNCQNYTCGNGIIELGEQCDDGNLEYCDGCSGLCENEFGFCGDDECCYDFPNHRTETPENCFSDCVEPCNPPCEVCGEPGVCCDDILNCGGYQTEQACRHDSCRVAPQGGWCDWDSYREICMGVE